MARSQGALFWELRTAVSMARLRSSQDRLGEAHDMLAAVYGKYAEGFALPELQRARAMLAALSAD